jgi:DNA-binding GntR family transcriptional regulator
VKRHEQLVPRLRRFFQENPGEILTFDDIAAKFDVPRMKVRKACMHLREEGLILTEVVAMVNPERPRK